MAIEEFADKGPQAAEDALRQKLGENDYLVDLWQMGEQMRMFAATPIGKLLDLEFRQDFNRAMRALLECDDPGAPAGRAAHAEARLNWRLLQKIEATLGAGKEAESIMMEQDRDQPEGDTHD